MPIIGDNLEEFKPTVGHYGFSAAKIKDLGATEYTLSTIVTDSSFSVKGFQTEIEKAIKSVINACKDSPRCDNLLIRTTEFNSHFNEIHGFKLLSECNLNDYDNIITPRGSTALYDATENAVRATVEYGKQLVDNDLDVNGIIFVITDGEENNSTLGLNEVQKAFKSVQEKESLESLITVLIGVNIQSASVSQALKKFEKDAGFSKYIELDNADPKTLAKLAEFISKSISSQSQSLGTGGPSTQIQSLTI